VPYKNIEDKRNHDRKKYAEEVATGQCTSCPKSAHYPYIQCLEHIEKSKIRCKKNRKRLTDMYADSNRCVRCVRSKIEEDSGFRTCINCRLKIGKLKGGSKYAVTIVQPTV
jgi:hypothetical protein